MLPRTMPSVQTVPGVVPMAGGLNLSVPELFAKPGTLAFAFNYEPQLSGGYRRLGGIERFDGQSAPNLAEYVLLQLTVAPTGIDLGDTDRKSVV